MIEMFGITLGPIAWAFVAMLFGASLVLLAKLYGLFFMTGNSPHRVGKVMSVNRAEVTEWSGTEGYVLAGGELWRAASTSELKPGDKVTVSAMTGLVLQVEKKQE